MTLPSRDLTVVVCDSDGWQLQAEAQLLRDHGFDVLGEAENAVEAITLATAYQPNAVVLTHEHMGLSGLDALVDLRALDPQPEVLLLSNDGTGYDVATERGAFDVVARGEMDQLGAAIDRLAHLLRTGEHRGSGDRRSGDDRRREQDWSQVHTQRRSGDDRRSGADRRDVDG
jgi:DNA-binding NarL/FixJ family response regulator